MCDHWYDPGIQGVECRHWVPYFTSEELGFPGQKLVLPWPPEPGPARGPDKKGGK